MLIKVKAATVNRTDCAMLRAKPFIMRFITGFLKPGKPILGTDFAGEIEAIGKSVQDFKVGDSVFGFDDTGVCSHAEYMVFPEDKAITTIPENITYQEAAASIEGAHYAYNILNKVEMKDGQKVLVNGATGAIGAATVQLSKYFGGDVVAVGNTKNIGLVKSLGASRVIDYTKEDFTKETEKYQYIFDAVGKSSYGKCKSLLVADGIYSSSELGKGAQNIFLALFTPMMGGKKVIFPIPTDIKSSLLLIKKLLKEGKFKSVIDKTYSLDQIVEAFEYVEKGEKTGNVILMINDD